MRQIVPAVRYYPGCLSSTRGSSVPCLIRQFQFPDWYENDEETLCADHDHLRGDPATEGCFERHTHTGEQGLSEWLRRTTTTEDQVFAFLREILQADPRINWTGYRVMGGVHTGNGAAIWSMTLFAKRPDSRTKVYTGENAPNVIERREHL